MRRSWAGQEVGSGNVVVYTTDHSTAVARREDVFLNTHQNLCLSTCFFRLNHVEVHFVTVKVSVVWSTNCEVESEGMPFHDTNFVNHHRHTVERRLSVKDSNIAIDKVALNLETWLRVTVAVNRCETVFNLVFARRMHSSTGLRQ